MDAKARNESELTVGQMHELVGKLLENTTRVVLGKRDVARLCLIAMLSSEHILLEDVPGVGKTLMGKALAKSVDAEFRRIQFTPDLLPSDIVGSSIFRNDSSEFVFMPGPIFSSFVLADEINRAPPRTQSALLEAMSDRQVTVDGTTRHLEQPFMVIATQNPFEFEGTYVLPESQMDRFLLRISMGYPDREVEMEILDSHRRGDPIGELEPVCHGDSVVAIQEAVRQVRVEDSIAQYMLEIVHRTRESADLAVGVSTRGALLWHRAIQASAFVDGRDYAVPDDVKSLAVSVCSHRIQLRRAMHGASRNETEEVIRRIVSQVEIP